MTTIKVHPSPPIGSGDSGLSLELLGPKHNHTYCNQHLVQIKLFESLVGHAITIYNHL